MADPLLLPTMADPLLPAMMADHCCAGSFELLLQDSRDWDLRFRVEISHVRIELYIKLASK